MKKPPPLAHLENSHSPYQDSALECWFLCETFPNYLSEKVGKVPPMLLLYCASLHSQVHDFTLQYPSLNKLTFSLPASHNPHSPKPDRKQVGENERSFPLFIT